MKPLIWLMNGSARVIIRMLGVDPDAQTDAMSEEEIKIIINNSYNGGEINQTELNYMQNIFSFDERHAKDIMVPRTQMVTLNEPFNVDELLETIKNINLHVTQLLRMETKTILKVSSTLKILNRVCFWETYQNQ